MTNPEQTPISDDGAFTERNGEVIPGEGGVNSPSRLPRLPAEVMPDWPATSGISEEAQASRPLTSDEQNAIAKRFDNTRTRSPKQLRQHP